MEKDDDHSHAGSHEKHSYGDENKHSQAEWQIPPPPNRHLNRRSYRHPLSTSSTPLLPIRQRKPARGSQKGARHGFDEMIRSGGKRPSDTNDAYSDVAIVDGLPFSEFEKERLLNISTDATAKTIATLEDTDRDYRPTGIAGFFFGFMYEEPFNESFDFDDEAFRSQESSGSIWNPLTIALFASFTLTTAATTVPILLIPTIGQDLLADTGDVSVFASRAAGSAVLGTACGKFLNGPISDVLGARRTSVVFSFLLALSLLFLGFCQTVESATWGCFYVEFFQSVQWPCVLVILATHYGPHHASATNRMYEGGIYVTSVGSRMGSLLGIPLFSAVLQQSHWRVVCLVGAWIALIGASVSHLFLADSPLRTNEPQNALHPSLLDQLAHANIRTKPKRSLKLAIHVVYSVVVNNLIPSLKHVLKSGTFWIVAFAHTGSSMVRTSERILSTYYHDTSMGYLSEEKASGLSVFSSLGTILGLAIAGTMFTHRKERQRKWLVSRLYMVTIGACYTLALFAIPAVHIKMDSPGLVLFFQILASFSMGFGIAVMFYHIPGLVSSSFGSNKGLFSAYVDGVAYGLASLVWKVVANAVQTGSGGGGWAYGWAAVALLIVLCAILMVEFMEHYFVRASGRYKGTYETILFA